jgi:hypothetical protein
MTSATGILAARRARHHLLGFLPPHPRGDLASQPARVLRSKPLCPPQSCKRWIAGHPAQGCPVVIVPDGNRYPVIVADGPEDVLQQHRVAVTKRHHVRSVLLVIEQIRADFLHDILGLGELDQKEKVYGSIS